VSANLVERAADLRGTVASMAVGIYRKQAADLARATRALDFACIELANADPSRTAEEWRTLLIATASRRARRGVAS
jgi:hypothetical protein